MRVIETHEVLLRYSLAATVVGPVTNENGWRLQIIRRMHAAGTGTTKAPF
ncbi:hypothetical protein PSYJA_08508 [Pseudomonas syringae pv. japonica str. M301072]|uniref:Uncharacterized protein n=1 Tax=Pseudomonas syringae pv. japonica str. M301072 TaxID=629262 RepID=F3FFL9_PSESX|nr:hypothetical protein PSYJA_08508 [Pseudomonas syringae pv. japonica str. M301072]